MDNGVARPLDMGYGGLLILVSSASVAREPFNETVITDYALSAFVLSPFVFHP